MNNKRKLIICVIGIILFGAVAAVLFGGNCVLNGCLSENRIKDFDSVMPYFQTVADDLLLFRSKTDHSPASDGAFVVSLSYDSESEKYYLEYEGDIIGEGEAVEQIADAFDNDSRLYQIRVYDGYVDFRNKHGDFSVVYTAGGERPTHLFYYGGRVKADCVIKENDNWYQVFI